MPKFLVAFPLRTFQVCEVEAYDAEEAMELAFQATDEDLRIVGPDDLPPAFRAAGVYPDDIPVVVKA